MDLIAEARIKLNISCHIPYPTVYNELMGFLENENCPRDVIVKVDTWLVKKTPNRYEIKIPSEIFYEYVKDLRERINKGMRIGEEHIINPQIWFMSWQKSIQRLIKMKSSTEFYQKP